jgi:hypothetical protein
LDWFAALAESLRDRETELLSFEHRDQIESPAAPLLVILSDAFIERHGEELAAVVSDWKGSVIPMVLPRLSAEIPAELSDRSPIFPDESRAEVVNHIVVASRTKPYWPPRWRELLAAARADDPELLDRSGLERANLLLAARPEDLIPELPVELRSYIEQSEAAVARRRRRARGLAVIAAAILLAAAAVALLQRHSASTAANAAREQARRAESDRLSRLSHQSLASDPDLPVLLARRAYELLPSAEARESLRAALDATPWHRSYRLSNPPASVLGSPSTTEVVVLGENGNATLIDSRTGQLFGNALRPHGSGGVAVGAISADGQRVALAYNGGLVEVRSMAPKFELLHSVSLAGHADSDSLSVVWSGAETLLSAWSQRPLAEIGLPGGHVRALPSTGVRDPIAIALSPDGRRLALANRSQLELLDAKTMRRCFLTRTHVSPARVSLSFDQHQERLLLARQESFATQFKLPGRCEGSDPHSSPLVAVPSAAVAVLPNGSVAAGTEVGRLRLLEPPAEYPAGEFPADSGELTGLAATAGAHLVTVGADSWLRVWPQPSPPAYPDGPLPLVELSERFGLGQTRATWRAMLAISSDGKQLTSGVPGNGELTTVRSDQPGKIVADNFGRRESFNYIGTSIRPVPGRPCRALLLSSGGSVAEIECGANRSRVIWQRDRPLGIGSIYNTAVSNSGDSVAISDSTEVEVTRVKSGAVRRVRLEGVRAIGFDRDEDLIALEGNQALIEVGTSGPVRRVPIHTSESEVAAAEDGPKGKVLLVGASGGIDLVNLENGRRLERVDLPLDLSGAIGVHLSDSGRLALIVSPSGYWVIDLAKRRILASGQAFEEEDVGSQPRDGILAAGDAGLVYLIRADAGIVRVPLARWRYLDGERLLEATRAAEPRDLDPGDLLARSANGR